MYDELQIYNKTKSPAIKIIQTSQLEGIFGIHAKPEKKSEEKSISFVMHVLYMYVCVHIHAFVCSGVITHVCKCL